MFSQTISVINKPIIVKLNIVVAENGDFHYINRSASFLNSSIEYYILHPNKSGNCFNLFFLPDTIRDLFYSIDLKNKEYCDEVDKNVNSKEGEIYLDSNRLINIKCAGNWSRFISSKCFYKDLRYDSVYSFAFITYGEYYLYDSCQFSTRNDILYNNIVLKDGYGIDFSYSDRYYLIPKRITRIRKVSKRVAKRANLLKQKVCSKVEVVFGESL